MEKKVFIAGKEIPSGNEFAASFVNHKRKVAITSEYSKGSEEMFNQPNGLIPVTWNRNSALSTRAMILGVFNNFSNIDEIVLIFDENFFAKKFELTSQNSDTEKILDEAISSYHYLTAELISRITKINERSPLKNPVKIVFLHKENFSLCDLVLDSKSTERIYSSPLVSAASAAFCAFAENTAASLSQTNIFLPMLVSCELDNDYLNRDGSLAGWLCDYMNALDTLKTPLSAKDKITWIRAGSKKPGSGFSLFR